MVADEWEGLHRGGGESRLPLGMSVQDEAQDRGHREHQRKDRENGVVSDEGGEVAGLVLAELLHHRKRKCRPRASLLQAVEPLEKCTHAQVATHCAGSPSGFTPPALGRRLLRAGQTAAAEDEVALRTPGPVRVLLEQAETVN